jgi:hypothetical protein
MKEGNAGRKGRIGKDREEGKERKEDKGPTEGTEGRTLRSSMLVELPSAAPIQMIPVFVEGRRNERMKE